MAHHPGVLQVGLAPGKDVQVGATHAHRPHAQAHLVGLAGGLRAVLQAELSGLVADDGLHGAIGQMVKWSGQFRQRSATSSGWPRDKPCRSVMRRREDGLGHCPRRHRQRLGLALRQHQAAAQARVATLRKEKDDLMAQIPDTMKARNLTREQVIKDVLLDAQPTKEFVTVEQVAALAVFLCSPAADQVRGVAWNMDGGWAAQ